MPGRTPSDAYEAFQKPLKLALSCLCPAKITTSKGGKNQPGVVHSWSINLSKGISQRGAHFLAQMHYEIIKDPREGYGPYRVTTRAYRYKLSAATLNEDIFRMHWHPTGKSDVKPDWEEILAKSYEVHAAHRSWN